MGECGGQEAKYNKIDVESVYRKGLWIWLLYMEQSEENKSYRPFIIFKFWNFYRCTGSCRSWNRSHVFFTQFPQYDVCLIVVQGQNQDSDTGASVCMILYHFIKNGAYHCNQDNQLFHHHKDFLHVIPLQPRSYLTLLSL